MKTKPQVRRYWCLLFVGLALLASRGSAHAQAPAPPASCDADEQCNRLANEAADASQVGRFDDAQRAYKAAYDKQPDTKLLFNLARVFHKAGRLPEAVTYYQKYLDAGAEGSEEQRLKAEKRLEEARNEQTATAVKPPQPTTPIVSILQPTAVTPVPQESSQGTPVYRKWWLWTAVGVAVAGVAISVSVGMAARRPDLTGYSDARPFGS